VLFAAILLLSEAGVAQSQSRELKRIGVLWSGTAEATQDYWGAFVSGMRDLGWIEGKSATFIMRFDEDDKTRLPRLAAELVEHKVDVIAVTTVAMPAARAATRTIPIVYTDASDPVAEGVTPTLARSVGNVTGVSWQTPATTAKRLQLARDLLPGLKRLGMIHDPGDPLSVLELDTYRSLLAGTDVSIRAFEVRQARDFPAAFGAIKAYNPDALVCPTLVLMAEGLDQTVRLAANLRLPTVTEGAQFAEAGVLLAYGVDYLYAYKRAAVQADKILKGAPPASLPWDQPEKFELVVNRKAAKAIGLPIPESILLQATRVIE
jgi:putative ABC transport system substrate-binding protein